MATKLDGQFTPGGRLVMGSLTEQDAKDYDGRPIAEEKRRYFFGVAVPKDAPGVMELVNAIWQMAATDYAQVPLVMNQINQGLAAKDFAWKIQDGDVVTYDKKTGQPRETPDYLKNCFIFKFSTQFEVDACDINGNQINRADIKKGDYVDIMFNAQVNGKMDETAGVYLNPVAIRRLGYGDPIVTGISASQAFANRSANVPAGATSMPTAAGATPPATGGMPGGQQQQPQGGMPGNPQPPAQGQTQTGSAGMPGANGASPQTASQPHNDILNGPGGQGGGGMPGM